MIYTVGQIREKTAPVAKAHGLQSVYLFGSYARGEATEQSDIDLRIVSPTVLSLFELGGLYADLEESLQKELDLVNTRGAEDDFLNRIREDEVLLYEV